MKLIVALVCAAAACGAVLSSITRRPRPPPPLSALELCGKGQVELVDERCNSGGCAKQSVRLAWERGGGVLYRGDSTGETEVKRVRERELSGLLASLSALEPRGTASDSEECGPGGCEPIDRALTITSECGGGRHTFTFMRARPVWDRARSECVGAAAKCTAERAWHAAFATTLAARFSTAFEQLRESAREG